MRRRYPIDESQAGTRLDRIFFVRDVLTVAPEIIGKVLVVKHRGHPGGRYTITDVEAYRGEEDKACHARYGRTRRTEIMYHRGGMIYMYFVYGMYWMLNIVAGKEDDPQAVLVRGVEGINGPGRVTRHLGLDGSFYGEDLVTSERIWFEDSGITTDIKCGPRIGINYAGEPWREMPWRFFTK